MYFDQQTGALHAVSWTKSFFLRFNKFSHIFPSLTEEKKEKRKESHTKTCNKEGVYQGLDVYFLRYLFCFIQFMTKKDLKIVLASKKWF